MFGRRRRQNRRGIGGGLVPFLPTQLSGCVLWLRADLGITTVDAAILTPNDISHADWTKFNPGTVTASRFTEASALATLHGVSEVAAQTGLQQNHTYHVKIGLPAASGDGRYVAFLAGNGAEQLYIDLQTGTISGVTAGITNYVWSGGVLDFDAVSAGGPNVYILTWDGSGDYNHDGNGLRYVQLGDNGLGAQVTVTQRNVSAWADQSGSAHHAAQVTGTKQPLYVVAGGPSGLPCVQGDAVGDRLVANWVQAQPTTTFIVHSGAAPAANETVLDGGGGIVNTLRVFGNTGPYGFHIGTAALDVAWASGWHVRELIADGASSSHRVDGGPAATGNAGANASGGVCLFSAGDDRFYSDDSIVEVVQYSRVLGAGELTAVRRYLGARYGIAVS